MTLTESQYKKWLNLSRAVCSNEQMAQDILQDLLLALLESNIQSDKLNDNYIFISLKNRFLKHIHKEKKWGDNAILLDVNKEQSITNSENHLVVDANDIMDHQGIADVHLDKLRSIEDIVLGLREYEQNLYKLHFLYNISQRRISRETGITMRSINNTIKKIVNKITEHHGKKNH